VNTRRAATAALSAGAVVLTGCEDAPSALESRGPGAARIEGLWWIVFWIAAAVFCIVVGFLVVALMRGRRGDAPVRAEVRWGEPFIVLSGVVLPAAILIGVFALSLRDSVALDDIGDRAELVIEIVAHDWWWEARYPNGAVTANEIHIPVGAPVRLRLRTADVLHSFWVPELQGKTDLVSGRVNYMWLQADEPGRYRGQCAEFCGLQHANMLFFVVAEPEGGFEEWVADEAADEALTTASAERGREVFLGSTCVGCHTIRGTPANGGLGPDLTHLAGRDTLMSGMLSNTRANLAAVVTDPQAIKPGAVMPPTELSQDELGALLDYLEQLE
jgi:cytochrome c oxidase subunit 2